MSIRNFSNYRIFCILVLLLLSLSLSGCPKAGLGVNPNTQNNSQPSGKAPRGSKSYTVLGKTYYPVLSADGYSEEGIASWYGSDFHGKTTANGEKYDMYSTTAAHKLLPFGTQLKVTSLENGKSCIVRINDRGPFVGGRIIDLTNTSARELGMLGQGTMRVRIETVGTVPGLQNGDLAGNFYVQIGSFSSETNASRQVQNMKDRGSSARYYFSPQVNYWRVQVGPYSSLNKAEQAADNLRSEFNGCFVVAE